MLKKTSECFDKLSMNGLLSDILVLSPFVLSLCRRTPNELGIY